jgi:hypothetical protein
LHPPFPPPVELDPTSETFLIWEREDCPQTGCVAMHLTGRCDDQALEAALHAAMDEEPLFHSHLDLAWQGGRHLFFWRPAAERPKLEIHDHTGLPAPKEISRWFYGRMAPLLGRPLNLAAAFPIRLQMHHLAGSRHLFMFVFHHAVCDAGRIHAFLRRAFAGYHRLVKSVEPPGAAPPGLRAPADPQKPALEPWPRYFGHLVRDAFRYPPSRVAVPAGDGNGTARREMLHVEIGDENLLAALRERGRREGGGLSDLLLAAIDLAVEEWNGGRGIASDAMLNFLAVHQRGRRPDAWVAAHRNAMAALPIPLGRDDRRTPDLLLKTIITRRKSGLARGLDVRFTDDLFRILGLARRLPFAARRKLLYPLLTLRNTLFLSNAGVLWPGMDASGRPTGETAMVEAGDLEIRDFYLSLGCVPTWPLGLVAQSFRGKLYLEYLSWGNLFTGENMAGFNELVLRKLAACL